MLAQPQALWLLLLLPLAVAGAALVWWRRERDLGSWAGRSLWGRLMRGFHPGRARGTFALLLLAAGGVIAALADPRWGTTVETVDASGADVVFVLDSSRSMAARDVLPSRLTVAKALVRQILEQLPDTRIALVQAQGDGVSLAPLSLDHALVEMLASAVEPGSLPQPGTALAPALTRAYQLFQGGEGQRIIVLLSDGEDHQGGVVEQGQRLAQAGVVVFTLGIGTAGGAEIPVITAGGEDVLLDAQGGVVLTRLQGESLRRLAEATGGRYETVPRADFDPSPLAAEIRALGSGERTAATVERKLPRFQWPLALAFLALVGYLLRGEG